MSQPHNRVGTGVPRFLYRGDSDPKRERKVLEFWSSGFLQTNLGHNGVGRDITSAPLPELVNRHVQSRWANTHFLSLTSDRAVAERYAVGREPRALDPVPLSESSWDTTIFTFDTDKLTEKGETGAGLYVGKYMSELRWEPGDARYAHLSLQLAFEQGKQIPVLLVDIVTLLTAHQGELPDAAEAVRKAMADSEWLLLPLEPFAGATGLEFTALIDASIVTRREKFRLK